MRKFDWAFFIAILLTGATACGQDFASISGQVTDSLSGEPIGGVAITASPDGVSTVTDESGRFLLRRLTPGSISLEVRSAFHRSVTVGPWLLREGDSRQVEIRLLPLTLSGSPQEVSAAPWNSPGVTAYKREELEQSPSHDVGGFLRQQGYYTQGDGRSEYVTLRGALPEGVLVLLDGQPLNPDGGAVDLSQFPTSTLQRVDVYTTAAAARFGPNAHGGAINMISRQLASIESSEARVRSSWGSYGDHQYALHWSGGIPAGLLIASDYDYGEADNDYEYSHPYLGELSRENNFARTSSAYLSVHQRDLEPLSFSARYYSRHQGVPGAVLQETPTANAARTGQVYSLEYNTQGLNLRAGLRQLTQSYNNAEPYSKYETHYLQVARDLEAHWRRQLSSNLLVGLGGRTLGETYFADDLLHDSPLLPTVSRHTQSLFGAATLSRSFGRFVPTLESRYRIDRLDNQTFTSPYAGLTLDWRFQVTLGVETSYGESYRYPPLDALFWQESVFSAGNATLRPETSISREWGGHLQMNTPLKVGARIVRYIRDVAGQITWRPRFDGKYQPVNIGRVDNRGTEISLSVADPQGRLQVRYSRTNLTALNKTESDGYYNLWVPFLPDRTERLDLDVNLWRLRLDYGYSFTGKRYLREANTKWLPPYVLHDLTVELKLDLLGARQTARLEILNLADKRYELLERMPMPPRRVRLSMSLDF